MAANHRETIKCNYYVGDVVALLRDARFSSELRLELKSENPTDSGVWFRFHHGTTFTSWGEKITITLTPSLDGQLEIDVHSECGMSTQIIDWGKNRSNVNAILNYVKANIGSYSTYRPASAGYAPAAPQPEAQDFAPKFCGRCGAPLPEGAIFCGKCGERVAKG